MTQPSRVLYLPPGVAAPAGVAPAQPPQIGVPFDRTFFEQVLGQSIQAFCGQVSCTNPVVELLTVDGTTHYVKGISGIADNWIALHTTSPEHQDAIQVFIPYQTIYRVAIHPCDDERKPLGFVVDGFAAVGPPPSALASATAQADAPVKASKPAKK